MGRYIRNAEDLYSKMSEKSIGENTTVKSFLPCTFEEFQNVVRVAMGKKPATMCFENANIFNVYNGKIEKTNVYIYDKWICYVGLDEKNNLKYSEKICIGENDILVPGYIETHSHPNQMYNPLTLGDYLTSRGTTVSINDNLTFQSNLSRRNMERIANQLENEDFHIWLWWAYIDSKCKGISEQEDIFDIYYLESWGPRHNVIQAGEFTAWQNLLEDNVDIEEMLYYIKFRLGKRIEGHLPGASSNTLSILSAAGVTADHESINGNDVKKRLGLGYYASLRYSSICQDLDAILQDLKNENIDYGRLMYTNDGVAANQLKTHSHSDMIKKALSHGISYRDAYRMATLNPAVYYRIDHLIGGIAPGRIANINVLSDIKNPEPKSVMVKGKWIYKDKKRVSKYSGKLIVEEQLDYKCYDAVISDYDNSNIGIELINEVITKPYYYDANTELKEKECYLTYINRRTGGYINTRLQNFADKLPGLASSYSASQDIIIIGKNKDTMKKAYKLLREMEGGIVGVFDNRTEKIQLPISGVMCDLPIKELSEKIDRFANHLRKCGYCYNDFTYSLLFLTATHLPAVRLTKKGIYSLKEKKVIVEIKNR